MAEANDGDTTLSRDGDGAGSVEGGNEGRCGEGSDDAGLDTASDGDVRCTAAAPGDVDSDRREADVDGDEDRLASNGVPWDAASGGTLRSPLSGYPLVCPGARGNTCAGASPSRGPVVCAVNACA